MPAAVVEGVGALRHRRRDVTSDKLDGSMHYSRFSISAGGVARNMSEALFKLGAKPVLLSVVGDDNYGEYLRSLLPTELTKGVLKIRGFSTAQCIVVFDSKGNCRLLIGEMDIHKQITPDMIMSQSELLKRSPLIVTDGNLPIETLACVLKIAKQYQVPVFYEPTDIPIAANPFLCEDSTVVKFISPNINELKVIAKSLGLGLPQASDILTEASEIGKLVAEHVDTLIITLGSLGLMIITRGIETDLLLSSTNHSNSDIRIRYYKTNIVQELVNVSGAGDCLASGIITGMLLGYPENICVSVGFAAAEMSLQSSSAVPCKLFNKDHISWLQAAPHLNI